MLVLVSYWDWILSRWKEDDPNREGGSVYFHPLLGRSFPANSYSGICYDDHVKVIRNYIQHDTYEYHTRELGSRQDYNGGVSTEPRHLLNYGALTDGPNYPIGKTCGIVRFSTLPLTFILKQMGSRFKD